MCISLSFTYEMYMMCISLSFTYEMYMMWISGCQYQVQEAGSAVFAHHLQSQTRLPFCQGLYYRIHCSQL